MQEWIWMNGKVSKLKDACVSIDDRGYTFADGVYEVIRVYNSQAFTLLPHLARLENSARAIDIKLPIDRIKLSHEIQSLIDRSQMQDAMVYLQITRGVQRRLHVYQDDLKPTLLFYVRELKKSVPLEKRVGMKLLPMRDERWQRCYIKSIALLPNILAKNHAVRAGADEAVFVEGNGTVTECSASNVYAIFDGVVRTHPVGNKVLPGITRDLLVDLAADLHIKWKDEPFTQDEAQSADEVFITASTREIDWVSHWNGKKLWKKPGEITRKLSDALNRYIQHATRKEETKSIRRLGKGCG